MEVELTEVLEWYSNVVPVPRYCGTSVESLHKFRAQVLTSYITHRSSGYTYGSPADLTGVPRGSRTHRRSGLVLSCWTRTPGMVARAYRTYGRFGYRCSRTELT